MGTTTLNEHLSDVQPGDLKETVHGVIQRYEIFRAKLPHKVHLVSEALKRHIVVFALDVVVFPLGLLWLFYRVARVLACHLMKPLRLLPTAPGQA